MFTTPPADVLAYIRDNDVKFLDIRFTDLPGVQQHFNIPASTVDEDFFVNGQLFDGSSIRGFASIHESDMQLIPDVTTATWTRSARRAPSSWCSTSTTPAPARSTRRTPARSQRTRRSTSRRPASPTPLLRP